MNICKQKNIQKFLAIMNFHLEENSIYIRFPINFKITLVYNSKSYLYNSAAMSYLIRSYTNVYRCFIILKSYILIFTNVKHVFLENKSKI